MKGKTVTSYTTVESNDFSSGQLRTFQWNKAKIFIPICLKSPENDVVAFVAESVERVKRTTSNFARFFGILVYTKIADDYCTI